jgi:hypothetical protein
VVLRFCSFSFLVFSFIRSFSIFLSFYFWFFLLYIEKAFENIDIFISKYFYDRRFSNLNIFPNLKNFLFSKIWTKFIFEFFLNSTFFNLIFFSSFYIFTFE